MADTAKLIQEGVLCESCGEYIGQPVGHTRECKACRMLDGEDVDEEDEEDE